MSSSNKIALTGLTAISGNGTTTSDAVQVNGGNKEIIAVLTVTAFTDGTYDTIIQHSYDGITFANLVTIPQGTAAGIDFIPFPVSGHLLYIRAVTTAAAVTTGASINIDLFTSHSRS